jgi:predicted amidophosphoribosyltransferase
MELTTILLIVSIFAIIAFGYAYKNKSLPKRTTNETEEPKQNNVKRMCPSCGKEISSSARKCSECKSFVSICPSCDKDSIFSTDDKEGKKRLKVQSGFSTLGWPITKIATCKSCDSVFLLCSYCGSPVPTASNNCPNCDAMLAVGVVPIVKELGEVVGGILQRKVKTPGRRMK